MTPTAAAITGAFRRLISAPLAILLAGALPAPAAA